MIRQPERKEVKTMITKKEYEKRRDEHLTALDVTPSFHYIGMFYHESAYLTPEAEKELRADVKERKAAGAKVLPGTNGKATYKKEENGDIILTSYYTDVALISNEYMFNNINCDGYNILAGVKCRACFKTWYGFSVTTLNHVNAFLQHFGFDTINKKQWIIADIGESIAVKNIV